MDPIKKTTIVKKELKVKAPAPPNSPTEPELESEPVEPTDNEIQALKLAKSGKPKESGRRGGSSENLAKGREVLQAKWAKIREDKQKAIDDAIVKRIAQDRLKKAKIAKDFGIVEEAEPEPEPESESEEEVVVIKKKKAPPKVVEAPAPKPKKKIVRYVEESESESEPEVVYVPRKKTKAIVDTPRPQIIFY